MSETRSTFLAAAGVAREVAALPVAGPRWEEPSALVEMSVGALVAHLARAVTNVDHCLEAAPPSAGGGPVSAAEYFLPVTSDRDSAINVRVRGASAEEALVGQRALTGQLDRALDRLRARLPEEPEERLIRTRDGEVLGLDAYLRTRLIELTTHIDDLCVSLGQETPPLPGIDVAIGALLEVATLRHGELAVLRALARRERDAAQALRVL